MLHQTIRNDNFKRNTTLQHCCDIVSNGYNNVPTSQLTLCYAKNRRTLWLQFLNIVARLHYVRRGSWVVFFICVGGVGVAGWDSRQCSLTYSVFTFGSFVSFRLEKRVKNLTLRSHSRGDEKKTTQLPFPTYQKHRVILLPLKMEKVTYLNFNVLANPTPPPPQPTPPLKQRCYLYPRILL